MSTKRKRKQLDWSSTLKDSDEEYSADERVGHSTPSARPRAKPTTSAVAAASPLTATATTRTRRVVQPKFPSFSSASVDAAPSKKRRSLSGAGGESDEDLAADSAPVATPKSARLQAAAGKRKSYREAEETDDFHDGPEGEEEETEKKTKEGQTESAQSRASARVISVLRLPQNGYLTCFVKTTDSLLVPLSLLSQSPQLASHCLKRRSPLRLTRPCRHFWI
jgi:hypothetical protein